MCDHAGARRICFCRRHSAAAQATVAHHPTPSRVASGMTAALQHVHLPALPGQYLLRASGACSREIPYNHALRRGHRAPEAVAAAIAKRAFVRAVPYLVTEGEGTLAHLHRCAVGAAMCMFSPAEQPSVVKTESAHEQSCVNDISSCIFVWVLALCQRPMPFASLCMLVFCRMPRGTLHVVKHKSSLCSSPRPVSMK